MIDMRGEEVAEHSDNISPGIIWTKEEGPETEAVWEEDLDGTQLFLGH